MINDFERIREDGKVIDENMTVDQMIALGWSPCRVVEARWRWQEQLLSVVNSRGLLAIVVPDRQHLAILWNDDDTGVAATLYVVSGDRQQQIRIADKLLINGQLEAGIYSWFEQFPQVSPSIFTCMFSRQRDQAMFRVDIDASTGDIVSIQHSR
ncbi:hypothetical protein [Pseudomonas protegens]|uniref:hypothetical protein n=1 Tax=Pseudomonas protegens TaxID=380021 RepID=UPI003851222C